MTDIAYVTLAYAAGLLILLGYAGYLRIARHKLGVRAHAAPGAMRVTPPAR